MKYDLLIKTIDPIDETVYRDGYHGITLPQVFSLLDIAFEYCGRLNTKAWIKMGGESIDR